MPEPVTIVSSVIGGVLGAVTWVSSLPIEFKYFFFLGGLALDVGVTGFLNFPPGAIGAGTSFLIANTFNIPGFVVSSLELLALFTFLPIFLFLLRNSLSN